MTLTVSNKTSSFQGYKIHEFSFRKAPLVAEEIKTILLAAPETLAKSTKGATVHIYNNAKHGTQIKLRAMPDNLAWQKKAKFYGMMLLKKLFSIKGTAFNERKIDFLNIPATLISKMGNVAKDSIRGFRKV